MYGLFIMDCESTVVLCGYIVSLGALAILLFSMLTLMEAKRK
jgi:hypothetical protein